MKIKFVIMLIVVLLISACAKEIGEEVKIGVIIPLTGVRADAGDYIKNGLELALNEINLASSTKYKINLIYEDTQYDPKIAVNAFNKVTNLDNVEFIIGTQGSSEALAVAPLAEENKILFITPGAQSDKISEAGDYIFRTSTHFSQDAPLFGKILAEKTKGEDLHIIAVDTDATPSFMNAFHPIFEAEGGRIGLLEKYGSKDSDFKTILTKIKSKNPKQILLIGPPKPISLQLKQAKELGIEAEYYGLGVLENIEFLNAAGDLANGIMFLSAYDESKDKVKEFKDKYKNRYKNKADFSSAMAYDTLYVLSNCFEKVGIEVDNAKKCLYETKDYEGTSGTFSFDKNGDVERNFVLKQIINGDFVKINNS